MIHSFPSAKYRYMKKQRKLSNPKKYVTMRQPDVNWLYNQYMDGVDQMNKYKGQVNFSINWKVDQDVN